MKTTTAAAAAFWLLSFSFFLVINGFVPSSSPMRTPTKQNHYNLLPTAAVTTAKRTTPATTTCLNSFMGSDGGILGIGTPELFTILLVGYFVLGPSDLYKIVKQVGKFVNQARVLSTDLTTTLEENMENSIQLEELRKAQTELTDAFSFRRTINVDDEGEAFSTNVNTPRSAETPTAVADRAAKSGKKKRIRRKKRVVAPPTETEIPDLEMPGSEPLASVINQDDEAEGPTYTDEEARQIEEEFEKYTAEGGGNWFDDDDKKLAEGTSEASSIASDAGIASSSSEEISSVDTPTTPPPATLSPEEEKMAQARFQQQSDPNVWNKKIMEKEEELEPMAKVMELLAVLDDERATANKRLEEEYQKRKELDDAYFQKQRRLLEETAADVQKDAYNL